MGGGCESRVNSLFHDFDNAICCGACESELDQSHSFVLVSGSMMWFLLRYGAVVQFVEVGMDGYVMFGSSMRNCLPFEEIPLDLYIPQLESSTRPLPPARPLRKPYDYEPQLRPRPMRLMPSKVVV